MSRVVKNLKHANVELTEFQYQVCLGTLLGDSSLSRPKNGRTYHLACYHTERQSDWLKIKWDWLQPFSRPIQVCEYLDKRNGKTYRGSRFHTISAPCFNELHRLIYPDMKRITHELMQQFVHPVALACLICDDGTWDKAGISIASKQFTIGGNEVLATTLSNNFDIHVTMMANQKYPFVRITARSVERTFNLCSKYIPDTMLYKFGGGNYKSCLVGKITQICPTCGKPFQVYASLGQIYCSRPCAQIGRPKGYETRTETDTCPVCGKTFLRYTKRQRTCPDCFRKPSPDEVCQICGKPVKAHGRKHCSKRCGTIAGHLTRGHKVTLPI